MNIEREIQRVHVDKAMLRLERLFDRKSKAFCNPADHGIFNHGRVQHTWNTVLSLDDLSSLLTDKPGRRYFCLGLVPQVSK